jgi:hypothetical protein
MRVTVDRLETMSILVTVAEAGSLCVPKTLSRVDDVTESPNLAR